MPISINIQLNPNKIAKKSICIPQKLINLEELFYLTLSFKIITPRLTTNGTYLKYSCYKLRHISLF